MRVAVPERPAAGLSLACSIVTTMAALFAGESAAFLGLCRRYRVSWKFFFLFLAVEAAFHLVILFFLLANRAFFYNIRSGEAESRVNAANKITLFRITMLPFLLFLIIVQGEGAKRALAVVIALTFVSDFVDGKLARRANLETYMGKLLDSASDYLLLGGMAAAFFAFSRLAGWLFALIIGRLFINALGMLILALVRKKLAPQTTPFGKIAIASIMVLLVCEEAAAFLGPRFPLRCLEIAAGLIVGFSVIDKVWYFARTLRGRDEPAGAN